MWGSTYYFHIIKERLPKCPTDKGPSLNIDPSSFNLPHFYPSRKRFHQYVSKKGQEKKKKEEAIATFSIVLEFHLFYFFKSHWNSGVHWMERIGIHLATRKFFQNFQNLKCFSNSNSKKFENSEQVPKLESFEFSKLSESSNFLKYLKLFEKLTMNSSIF